MKVTDLDDAAGLPEIGKLQSRFEIRAVAPGPGASALEPSPPARPPGPLPLNDPPRKTGHLAIQWGRPVLVDEVEPDC